jgi:hypothetical protein
LDSNVTVRAFSGDDASLRAPLLRAPLPRAPLPRAPLLAGAGALSGSAPSMFAATWHRLAAGSASALSKYPLRTKVAQGGLICTGGDLIAQAVSAPPPPPPPSPKAEAATATGWDSRRTAVYTVLGCGWTGAFNHYYLGTLSRWFPASAGMRAAVAKTVFNQLVVAPGLFVPIFFAANGAVRGWSADRTVAQLQAEYVPTVVTMWTIWFPSNFVMFALVPVQHQVLWMSVCNLGWNVVLSLASNRDAARYSNGGGDGTAAAPAVAAASR